ncbi:hypothetical protein AXW84_12115 [Hymenobacter sp. PAMC 26628]|nr:hypothetical protein AXW84_12115 [Hymenobacter sp. PAMC 26628]
MQHEATPVLAPSPLSLALAGGEVLGPGTTVESAKTAAVNTTIAAPVYRKSQVVDRYNQLTIYLKGRYGLVVRAYDDGVAYRFFTQRKGRLTVQSEEAAFNFAPGAPALLPFVRDLQVPTDLYMSSFESLYTPLKLADMAQVKGETLAFLPALVALGDGKKAVLVESDVEDYPGMLLKSGAPRGPSLRGDFARYPAAEQAGGFHNMQLVVPRREAFIAQTKARQSGLGLVERLEPHARRFSGRHQHAYLISTTSTLPRPTSSNT